jgi:hypothetical protein
MECWVTLPCNKVGELFGDVDSLPVKKAPPRPEVAFEIDSQTGLDICKVFINPSGRADGAGNRLGDSVLNPHSRFTLKLAAGFYSMTVSDCRDGVLYGAERHGVGPGPEFRSQRIDTTVLVFINNPFAYNLYEIQMRPSDGSWTVLHNPGGGEFMPGKGIYLDLLVGYYDFIFTTCSGSVPLSADRVYVGPNTSQSP